MAKDEENKDEGASFELPEDLTGLSADELNVKYTEALAAFDAIRGQEDLSDDDLRNLEDLADAAEVLDKEIASRAERAQERRSKVDGLAGRFRRPEDAKTENGEGEGDGTDGEEPNGEEPVEVEGEPANEGEGADSELVTASGKHDPKDDLPKRRRINVPLDEVRRRAAAKGHTVENHEVAKITASANIPGVDVGGRIDNVRQLSHAFHLKSRQLPSNGSAGRVEVASVHRSFEHTIGLDASPEQAMEILRKAADPNEMVAAGGWCAPSIVIYDFFNIASADGLLDLPTVNAARGGIRWPVSPSISEFLANIWLWTETNDIQAATGAGTKPCARPTCPSFLEERLAMHGYCATAGNLTEWAYPELIDNYINLLVAAHAHVNSNRQIAELVAESVVVTGTGANLGVAAPVLNFIELQVVDYRLKYRMAEGAILEAVFPAWTFALIRADIAKQNGYDNKFQVTDQEIRSWFDMRGVRAQFVQDWQVGAGDFPGQSTARTDWPSTIGFMLYAAGTFVLGTGPTINLGVDRDSVLNAKNDHTAAWSEEGWLVAKMGHESRLAVIDVDPSGVTGAQADLSGIL